MSELTKEEREYMIQTATSEVNRSSNLTLPQQVERDAKVRTAVNLRIISQADATDFAFKNSAEPSRNKDGKVSEEQPDGY